MKKFLALALALIMVFSLATTAFAAEGESGDAPNPPAANTVKISVVESESGAPVTGHTYNVYQIFTGDVAVADGKTLSNIKLGQDVNVKENGSPYTVEEILEMIEGESPEAAADILAGIVDETPIKELNDGNGHKANVVPGYYLIIDVTEKLPVNETASAFILEVAQSVQIKSKHTAGPVVEKKIKDTNDSLANSTTEWQDSADHDIGDAIPFKLEMTVPSAFRLFKENNAKADATRIPYRFVFHDTEEQGLAFEEITSVYVWNDTNNNKIIDERERTDITAYSLVKNPVHNKGGNAVCTFDVVFEDLTAIDGVEVGSVIIVEYTSILDAEKAILGNQGNVNTVFGEYKNYYDDEGPNYTPKDSVIAFTYKVVVNKVHQKFNEKGEPVLDDKGNPTYEPLAGAEFTLEKFVASENGSVEVNEVKGDWTTKTVVKTEDGKVFTFTGLDDGNYRLTESKTPDGYNTIEPIYFTVTAEHDIEWTTQDRTEVLDSLTGNVTTGEITFTPAGETYGENETKVVSSNAVLTTDVINKKGTVLPETGGMGTTIFYAVGGVLAAAAVVLLVTKKRASSAK